MRHPRPRPVFKGFERPRRRGVLILRFCRLFSIHKNINLGFLRCPILRFCRLLRKNH